MEPRAWPSATSGRRRRVLLSLTSAQMAESCTSRVVVHRARSPGRVDACRRDLALRLAPANADVPAPKPWLDELSAAWVGGQSAPRVLRSSMTNASLSPSRRPGTCARGRHSPSGVPMDHQSDRTGRTSLGFSSTHPILTEKTCGKSANPSAQAEHQGSPVAHARSRRSRRTPALGKRPRTGCVSRATATVDSDPACLCARRGCSGMRWRRRPLDHRSRRHARICSVFEQVLPQAFAVPSARGTCCW